MDEKGLEKLFHFFISIIYFFVLLEAVLYVFYDLQIFEFGHSIMQRCYGLFLFKDQNILYSKIFTISLVAISAIGTKPKKDLELNVQFKIVLPIILGFFTIIASVYLYHLEANTQKNHITNLEIAYLVCSLVGVIMLHIGLDNISKIIKSKIGKDIFNKENESFLQTEKLEETPYSFNIPMSYYYQGKTKKGWLNLINPFRGTIVTGVPESGKSFSIIVPMMKTFIQKGFTCLVYDYKFPDLAKIAYHQWREQKRINKNYKHAFHVVNLNNIEGSRRVNPLHPDYMNGLAASIETAKALVSSIQKGSNQQSGSDQFFTESAVNFLASIFYFFSTYKAGKYSTFPHVLAFLNQSYEDMFNVLTTNLELQSLLAPYLSAHRTQTYQQLEGQIGTLRVHLGKINTKEAAWVFSGNDVNLRLSSPKSPSIIVMANLDETLSINSTIYSLLLNRLTKLINTKGNLPSSIIVDELPTIFFYKIQNLISTARENKVAIVIGLQEITQLIEEYGKNIADTITSVIGNTISGSVKNKETLAWLERIFGKTRQIRKGANISKRETTLSISEQMDNMIPANKIVDLITGEVVAKIARNKKTTENYNVSPSTYKCQIQVDLNKLNQEKKQYLETPFYYSFASESHKNEILLQNMRKIERDIERIIESI